MSFILLSFSIIFIIFSLYKIYRGKIYYFILIIISVYSFLISLASLGLFISDFALFWSNRGVVNNSNYVASYTLFILWAYFLFLAFSEFYLGKASVNLNKIRGFFNNKSLVSKLRIISFLLLFVNFLYFYFINWGVFWSNDTYLLISSLDGLRLNNNFSKTLHMLAPLNGLLCCILLALSINLKNKFSFFLILLPAVFFICLKIGDHSRLSAVYIGAMALIFYLSDRKLNKKILFPIFLIFSYLCVLNSLIGRSSDSHGLIAVSDFFYNIVEAFKQGEYLKTIGNIFEGAFVHGEAFNFLNYQYPNIFKLLSFSPFPSAIDGYDYKAHSYSLRLHTYVPMGATGELLIFGLNYILIYFFIIFIAIYTSVKVFNKNYIIVFIVSIFLIVLASYLQFTYPLRNIIRFFYIAIFINYMAIYIPRLRWGK